MQYCVNSETSKLLSIQKGTPQGESLSPILFLLFISDLEDFLRAEGLLGLGLGGNLEILSLAFADDIVILTESQVDVRET